MECKDCHLGQRVPKLINKYTCGLDHSEDRAVRNGWDGCDIVESVRAREHASKLECPKCQSDFIFIETIVPARRTVTEHVHGNLRGSSLKDSKLEAEGTVERRFWCQGCGHKWEVPDWFPKMWVGKPEDATHMTSEELQTHLKGKILGELRPPRQETREPVQEYEDHMLLSAQALRDSWRCPKLEQRVIDALYEECSHLMPQELEEVEQPVYGPGAVADGDCVLLHEALASKLKRRD